MSGKLSERLGSVGVHDVLLSSHYMQLRHRKQTCVPRRTRDENGVEDKSLERPQSHGPDDHLHAAIPENKGLRGTMRIQNRGGSCRGLNKALRLICGSLAWSAFLAGRHTITEIITPRLTALKIPFAFA